MRKEILIGLGLGLTSAVVFASATTGPLPVRYALYLLTALPIFLAGLGWGWMTAAIAALASMAIIGSIAGLQPALAFGITQTLPAVILCYLALLNRPLAAVSPSAPANVEWYPPGRLLLWAAIMAGVLTLGFMAWAGADLEKFNTELRDAITASLKNNVPNVDGKPQLDETQIRQIADIGVSVMPGLAAVSWMSALILNLWLAGRVTLASGQLQRPWPDLSLTELPRGSSLMLLAGLLASGAAGLAGAAGKGFAGAFFLAFVLVGLAVIHHITRGKPWRPFALWLLYVGMLIFSVWPAVLVALVGLAESTTNLRARTFPKGPPPPAGPHTPNSNS